MGRRLTDAEIVERYLAYQSSFDIGLEAGCSSEKVRDIVRAAGVAIRPKGGNRPRPDRYALPDAEICKLYQAGTGMTTLAAQAGTNASQIRHILIRHGVPVRSVREANRLLAKKRQKKP